MPAYPDPPNAEISFMKALLIYGPMPDKGWRIQSYYEGRTLSVEPRSIRTKVIVSGLIRFFMAEVHKLPESGKWTPFHIERVARHWKNQFLVWLWDNRKDTSEIVN